MTEVQISIGKSQYKIDCAENEKEKLLYLANLLNERVNRLSISLRNMDEKTLLVMAALTIADESNKKDVDENEDESPRFNDQDMQDAVSENMENIADYIQKLSNKIKNY